MTAELGWTWRLFARASAMGAIAFAAGAGAGFLIGHEPPPAPATTAPPSPRPAGPAELALLAPVAPGGELSGWRIRAVHAVDAGSVRVVAAKEEQSVELMVALVAEDGPEPPATAGRYGVFYRRQGVAADDGEQLAKALAATIERNLGVPTPPGLAPFVAASSNAAPP